MAIVNFYSDKYVISAYTYKFGDMLDEFIKLKKIA